MLIESKIKRPKAPIEMADGTVYYFTPADGNPASPHVCEITSEAHIERLLAIPEGYRIARTSVEPAPLERAPQAPSPGTSDAPAATANTDQAARIQAILAQSVPDLRATVPSINDVPLLRAAIAAEQAGKNRNTVLQALNNRIGALPPVPVGLTSAEAAA